MDKIRKKKIKKGTVEQLVLDERMATVFFSVLDWLFLLITNILRCFAVEKWTRFSLSFCQFVIEYGLVIVCLPFSLSSVLESL